MLLRAAGGILVITATSAGGILAGERVRKQDEQLK